MPRRHSRSRGLRLWDGGELQDYRVLFSREFDAQGVQTYGVHFKTPNTYLGTRFVSPPPGVCIAQGVTTKTLPLDVGFCDLTLSR